MMTRFVISFLLISVLSISYASPDKVGVSVISFDKHLLHDIAYKGENYYAVIEVPAGSTERWELNKITGNLKWERKKGKFRHIKYLGYPANYGFIPQTELGTKKKSEGGAVDVFVLGKKALHGKALNVAIIGAIKLEDEGKIDPKVIAVDLDSHLRITSSLGELEEIYPGMLYILRLWLEGYKETGKIQFMGYMSKYETEQLIEEAHDNWMKR